MPRSVAAALLLALAACAPAMPHSAPPRAEFLLASGDSTYWITADARGIRVRGSPIILANYDGRFHELYVVDDDHSYDDALLVGQLVYSRDLVTGDSTLVFTDTLVGRATRDYARAHPDEQPLDSDEDGRDHPSVAATSEVSLLAVHGPYLSLEYHADLRSPTQRPWHTTWRTVVDLRTARAVPLDTIAGTGDAARVIADGRRAFSSVLDSARHEHGDLASVVSLTMAELAFDPRSFSLTDSHGAPAVAFAARTAGPHSGESALALPPVRVNPQPWWGDVRRTLPTFRSDRDGSARWLHPGYTLQASYDSSGDYASLTLVDSTHRAWPVAVVQGPVHRIFWLDVPPVDSATRHSLARGFDAAALYGDGVYSASDRHARPAPILRAVALTRRAHAAAPPSHLGGRSARSRIPRPRS
ncbi:MAG TPA: hypothetical protein VG818_13595 [Gemmatimonadaceae bacterium]|nr:hypothetical protein [Gemmatimonadaceae bacterium]